MDNEWPREHSSTAAELAKLEAVLDNLVMPQVGEPRNFPMAGFRKTPDHSFGHNFWVAGFDFGS